MKKRVLWLLAMCSAVLISGCSINKAELSETEMNEIAEYTAKLVLKHTNGYEPALLEEIEVKDNPNLINEDFKIAGKNNAEKVVDGKGDIVSTESAISTGSSISNGGSMNPSGDNAASGSGISGETGDASSENGENGDTDMKNASGLNEIYDKSGLEVVYGGTGVYTRYPENEGYFSLVAGEKMKLLAIEFAVKNTSDKEVKFLQNNDVTYRLTCDGKNFYKPSVTLLENDMQFIDVSIKAGKTVKGVIIFNVFEDADLKNAKLHITGNNKEYILSVAK